MKKFIGYINDEKFDDVNLFTEKLKDLDSSKLNSIKAEYYEGNVNQDQAKQEELGTGTADSHSTKPKKSKFDPEKIKDQSYVISRDDINNMDNNDFIVFGQQYANEASRLKDTINECFTRIKENKMYIKSLNAEIADISAQLESDETALSDAQKDYEQLEATGRLTLADSYNRYIRTIAGRPGSSWSFFNW